MNIQLPVHGAGGIMQVPGGGASLHREHPKPGCVVLGASCRGVPGMGGVTLHTWHPRKIPQQGTLHPAAPGASCAPAPSQAMPYLGASTRQQAWGPWDIRRGEDLFCTESFMQRWFLFCTRRLLGRVAGSGAPLPLSGLCKTRFLHPAFVRGGCWQRRSELFY